MKIVFVTLFAVVFLLISLYTSRRFIYKLGYSIKVKKALSMFLVVNIVFLFSYLFNVFYFDIPNIIFWILSLSIGILFLLFCISIVYDLLNTTNNKLPISNSRREFFKKSLDASSIGFGSFFIGKAIYNTNFIKLEKVNIKLKNLKKEYKIVQISDLHIGRSIGVDFVKDVVKIVNSQKPDIVVITGDLIDSSISKILVALKELDALQSKYGIYFIAGNHEYFHNLSSVIKYIKTTKIKFLANENVYIGENGYGFNLSGVYDVFGYRFGSFIPDLKKALEGNDEKSPTVLLAHQPRYIDEVDSGVDLMLSGHTHGGQIYPFNLLVKLQQIYVEGLHEHNENLQIYVNKGTGFWGPAMRLGTSCEVTSIIIS